MPELKFNAREAITRLARIESERVAQTVLKRIEAIAPSDMMPAFCYVRSELEKAGNGSVAMLRYITRGIRGRHMRFTFVQLRQACENEDAVSVVRWGFELYEYMSVEMIADILQLTVNMMEVEVSCREIYKESVIIDA